MKKLVAFMAVAALATTAFAGISNPVPASTHINTATLDLGTGQTTRGTTIYADLVTSGYFFNCGTSASYPLPLGDDIHAISGGTITQFTFGYYNGATSGTFGIVASFFANDALDSTPPPTPTGFAGPTSAIAWYTLTGLPVGAWYYTITGVSIPVGPNFFFEMDFSGAYFQAGTGASFAGPLVTNNPAGTVGYSHDLISQTGSLWGSSLWADFTLSFDIVPEPASLLLLGLAGVLLRRR
jgi:hypothetical protein